MLHAHADSLCVLKPYCWCKPLLPALTCIQEEDVSCPDPTPSVFLPRPCIQNTPLCCCEALTGQSLSSKCVCLPCVKLLSVWVKAQCLHVCSVVPENKGRGWGRFGLCHPIFQSAGSQA